MRKVPCKIESKSSTGRIARENDLARLKADIFHEVAITGDCVNESRRERIGCFERGSRGKAIFDPERTNVGV